MPDLTCLNLCFLISCDIVEPMRWLFCYYAGGTWHLGMNLNPSDGHVMGFTKGWESNSDIGNVTTSFSKDYLSKSVWNLKVKNIAIVRHQKVRITKHYNFSHFFLAIFCWNKFRDLSKCLLLSLEITSWKINSDGKFHKIA